MLTVVCFKWFDPRGRYNERVLYDSDHVNRLYRMVDRHLKLPHRFVCVTDDPTGLAEGIIVRPIDMSLVRDAGHRYAKLMIFRPDAAEWLGERILMLDLDTLIVGDLDPLVDRTEDFVARQNPGWSPKRSGRFNSSMVLLRAGSKPDVWNSFKADEALAEFNQTSSFSDQAWIAKVLGPDQPVWTKRDGVLSFKKHLLRRGLFRRERDINKPSKLPRGARIVFFHGGVDPRQPELQAIHPWIKEHMV